MSANPKLDPDPRLTQEESLDPRDWDGMRRLGHRMLDDAMDYLERVRERPVWKPVPESTKKVLRAPLPVEGQDAAAVYEEFRRDVFPHTMGNIHPRFWGWVIGTGTPFGVLAELMASTMNPNIGGGDQGPNYVEVQTLSWLKEMLGYPAEASGLLVSGGSMANLVGIAVARNAKAQADIAEAGLKAAPRQMVLYASTETHNSVHKAVSLLGLGRGALREIAVDAGYRIDVAALRRAIAEDRKAGLYPFCVVGNAARSTPAPSTRFRSWPTSARPKTSGFTWTERSARWPRSLPIRRRLCAAWSGPTRWPSISTSGCTFPIKSDARWYAGRSSTGRPSSRRRIIWRT